MGKCPRCHCEGVIVRHGVGAAPGGFARIECADCGRFIEWRKDAGDGAGKEVATGSSAAPATAESTDGSLNAGDGSGEQTPPPEAWLYVSKRLELEWLPNVSLWAAPVITFGRADGRLVAFYRLTAPVFVWLEVAGEALQNLFVAGRVDRDQVQAYCDAMDPVWAFARAHLDPLTVREARGHPPALPEAWSPK